MPNNLLLFLCCLIGVSKKLMVPSRSSIIIYMGTTDLTSSPLIYCSSPFYKPSMALFLTSPWPLPLSTVLCHLTSELKPLRWTDTQDLYGWTTVNTIKQTTMPLLRTLNLNDITAIYCLSLNDMWHRVFRYHREYCHVVNLTVNHIKIHRTTPHISTASLFGPQTRLQVKQWAIWRKSHTDSTVTNSPSPFLLMQP